MFGMTVEIEGELTQQSFQTFLSNVYFHLFDFLDGTTSAAKRSRKNQTRKKTILRMSLRKSKSYLW